MTEITKDMLIGNILDADRGTAKYFLEMGMHCLGCPASRGESVEQACMVHGVDVDSLVADIINPGIAYVVSLITGALKTAATSTVGDTSAVESVMDMSKWIIPGTSINIGNFLSAIINFLILAFIIFCVVKGLNKLNDKFKKKVEEEVTPAGPTQEELLAEIRDLLKDKE